jgi:glyoxylase-like metal-dependent hydrolase (beta-lactamase superfamily II)
MSNSRSRPRYEYGFVPEIGETIEILPGLKWLRLPLPFMLGHINVWLLQDGDQRAIVDTGIFTRATRQAWDGIFSRCLDNKPLTSVIVTHLHPDHVGCAGWLCERFGIDLFMTREEYLMCRVLISDSGKPMPDEGLNLYRSAGFSAENLVSCIEMTASFGKIVSPLPASYHRLHEDRPLRIGPYEWQVFTGRGHSPEHACLYCPDQNVLISGDQILPTISSNVSVYSNEPASNPLAGWFESLRRLKTCLPDDVLVLPAHGKPFRGVKQRLDALIEEHETGLGNLRELCREPKRAIDVFAALFKSEITEKNLIMATGEAIAHLNYLINEGELGSEMDQNENLWYFRK